MRPLLFLSLLLSLWTVAAQAHKASDSYLNLSLDGDTINGRWDIALRDLDYALGLDANQDGNITWGEVRARHADIGAYALAHLRLRGEQSECVTAVTDNLIDRHGEESYAVLRLRGECWHPLHALTVDYRLLFDLDPQHRGLLRLEQNGRISSAVLSPQQSVQQFNLAAGSFWRDWWGYMAYGIEHIWLGYDHILFLIALLLPAVLRREAGRWVAVGNFRGALIDTAKIVTAFTLAHSLTLTLAALDIVSLPSRLVESLIAVSVMIAAFNNIRPMFHRWRALVAFGFGLIHGFGFAAVLGDLNLKQEALLWPLLGFNLGVEVGQLAIVLIFLPLGFLLRDSWFYQRALLRYGSCAIAALAGIWLLERSRNLQLLS